MDSVHQSLGKYGHDELWNKAMDEELDQIEKNDTLELVPRSKNKNVIGTKWVLLMGVSDTPSTGRIGPVWGCLINPMHLV